MGNNVCKLCIPIKLITNVRKPSKPSTSSSTIAPSFIDLFQQSLLELNNDTPIALNGSIPVFICQICFESKPQSDALNIEGCNHFYCTNCTLKYIVSKLQDNVLNLMCPEQGCIGVLNPQYCKTFLPNKVSVWWENALSESVIPENVKFYCPFNDCSALLINNGNKGKVIRESKCSHCERNICVQCKAPWHAKLSCEKFQRMKNKEDDLMEDLAKRRNWRRCPNCKRYVERNGGCNHMRCRCHHSFCYHCGKSYSLNLLHSC
ncbi:PREDICTED: probable E3 ubiquitin-protein ligase ARI10 [Lupinus angustifolius]|uniref:probable E3 ubiquitin-protein ligase ARI10 n=1 Tax=Lupinus angustifolius TaxID=3871 RepID=UPI00092F42FA|nr:PREDICTED: probable E3 ubiquitin-protein ligase ARI10 [Lupinus angustifolius]